jgi:hypothetical protein
MDFLLTDEHRLVEQSVREWAGREVAPRIKDLDREHRFDPNVFPQMAELGLLGISVPAEYGGAGMDYISLGIASEELEYVDTSLRVIMSVHAGLNCLSLLTWGNEDQKQRYLVPQAQGKKIATYGLTEPAAGTDVRGIQTVAIKKGDRYYLTGEKMWISLADVADNFLVFAWSDLEKKKARDVSGLSAFIVERGFKGFSSGTIKEKWGILAGNTGYFKMDEMEVPEANLLGRPGEGFKIDVRARPGPLHGGRGRHGPDPGLPRRESQVCEGAEDVWRRDRPASARQRDDRADGIRLSGVPAAVAARRVAQEPGPAEHAGDRTGEVVLDGGLGARRRQRRAGARRQWILGRLPGGPLLSELQGRGHLRRHARNPRRHAGRLPARVPLRPADAL